MEGSKVQFKCPGYHQLTSGERRSCAREFTVVIIGENETLCPALDTRGKCTAIFGKGVEGEYYEDSINGYSTEQTDLNKGNAFKQMDCPYKSNA